MPSTDTDGQEVDESSQIQYYHKVYARPRLILLHASDEIPEVSHLEATRVP